jgi:hypothetical protein
MISFPKVISRLLPIARAAALTLSLGAGVAHAQLISETFTSSPAANFTVVSGGTWAVTGGKYVLTSPITGGTGNNNLSTHNTNVTGDWTLTVDASTTASSSVWNDFSVIFGYQNSTNYYYFSSNESNDAGTSGIMKVTGGTVTQLADITTAITGGTTYAAKVVKTGSTYQVYRNNVLLATATDSTWASGKVGFGTLSDGASYDNLIVTGAGGGGTVAAPGFSPGGGTYTSAQSVTITSSTSGATIRYTTNGTTPTDTVGTLYSAPVSIGATATLKAIAYKSGMTNSTVTSATYTINIPQVAAPSFSPPAGSYSSAQSVTITSATSGASIRYTTNGTTPTSTTGTLYASPVSISSSATLKAIAYKSGMTDSTVTSGVYTINSPGVFPDPSNTGWQHTGVTLTPMAGPVTITTAGYVLDSMDVSGIISVRANNVTIKRCRVRGAGGGSAVITAISGISGLQVIDCEIDGLGNSSNGVTTRLAGLVQRCYIRGTSDGCRPSHDTVIRDNYMYLRAPAGAHSDGVQTYGATNVQILHNTIDIGLNNVNGCVFVDNGSHHITVDNNLFNGGSSAFVGSGTYIVVTNNTFGQLYSPTCGLYGACNGFNPTGTGNQWSGNEFSDGTTVTPDM